MCIRDRFKIEEVITNYLNNAMNHLDGERQITISIFREGDQVRKMCIRDRWRSYTRP